MGLYMDMSEFEIPVAMRHGSDFGILQLPNVPSVRWQIEYIGNDDFAAAVAHELDSDSSAESNF